MIEQEQFCALPRMELCEARVGRDRLGIDELARFVWRSVADGGSRNGVDEESHS